MDTTGTGNSLLMRSPHVLQLIMDSLRYWVTEMHVDGFRFDLAATLARQFHEVDRLSSFFDLVQQDPVVSQVKLIAEPWDVGEGGYQVGNFPPLWTEWNGKYRDTVRDLWRGETSTLAEFASRLTGSSDLYQDDGRRPLASINFVTCHDGFTLRDLVSYNDKHNDANGEDNRDGESHNRSWNCGVEGETDDPAVSELRARQMRNFMATLMLSQGVPMLSHGDEVGRTQRGNNNAYCQDSELAWVEWPGDEGLGRELLDFTRAMVGLRKEHPVFRRRRFFHGRLVEGTHDELSDIAWFTPEGEEMTQGDWDSAQAPALAVFLNGNAISEPGPRGAHHRRRVPADVQRHAPGRTSWCPSTTARRAQGGQVLLPVLGHPLGTEIEHMEVDGNLLRYYDHVFPLREGPGELPLPQLLDAQWYRPVWWRLARTELNYRRFFSISELIGVRVEDPEVFEATHAKILQLLHEGVIDGLRVDHPDGLADPGGYLRRLHEATGGRWTVVEKILADGDTCRRPGRSRAPRATTRCGTSTVSSRIRPGPGSCWVSTGVSRPHRRTGAGTGRRRCDGRRTRCSRTSWRPRWTG
ncbi:Glycogen debranching enzyme [Streptomyces alboniger]